MRKLTISNIAECIKHELVSVDRTFLVAVDGSDGSGKSYFANELKQSLAEVGLSSVIGSIDDFHNPREVRYRKGSTSPAGFFEDSYDLHTLKAELLNPIYQGTEEVLMCSFDTESDTPGKKYSSISNVDVFIFEGLFLHRDELIRYWDLSIYLKTDFAVSVPRGNARFGLNLDPEHDSNNRYVEGNKIYRRSCNPESRAGIVVNNDDLACATIISNQYGPVRCT